jgi:CTP:molybdopterin cytidylyltransferase MocA
MTERPILMQSALPTTVLILAAGASARMRGGDKLLEPVQGAPLLRRVVTRALATGLPVLVTLDPARPARAAALEGLAAKSVLVDAGMTGMAASLRAGVASLTADQAVLILLADMPDIDAADMALLITAYQSDPRFIWRATASDGTPGHPVLFPPWARAQLLALTGDVGAKPMLQAHAAQTRFLPLPNNHATTDLNTPEDWAHWRAKAPTDHA